MTPARFSHSLRITYADCTVGNHVYYSRYLDLLESARGEFFRHLGRTFLSWQEGGFLFPVIECQLRYHAAARYDDLVSVEVQVLQAEGVRLGFGYRVVREDGCVLVQGETRHVCTGLEERPKRLPAELTALLAPYRQDTAA